MTDNEIPGLDDTTPPPTDSPPPDPPPPPSGSQRSGWSPPPLRSLTRRSHDRVLGGVAGGLGDYFNVDPAIFRLVFVGLSFAGGSGFVLYLVGWLLLQDRDTGTSHAEALLRNMGGPRSIVPWVLGGIVALIVLNSSGVFDTGLLWAALLIGAGVAFYRRNDTASGDSDRHGVDPAAPSAPLAHVPGTEGPLQASQMPPPHGQTATSAGVPTGSFADAGHLSGRTALMDDGWRPTPYVEPPSPPPPPSLLGRITVAAVLIIGGAVALLDNFTALDVAPDRYAALAVIVVGAGLLVGSRFGRSRGLIALGVVLVIAMALAAVARTIPDIDGAGERVYQPETVAEVRDSYEFGIGSVTIDLTELRLEPNDDLEIDGAVGIGELVVEVPPEATVVVDATVGGGTIQAFGRESSGTGAELSHRRAGDEGAPTITLDLTSGLGAVDVRDGAPAPQPRPATSPGA